MDPKNTPSSSSSTLATGLLLSLAQAAASQQRTNEQARPTVPTQTCSGMIINSPGITLYSIAVCRRSNPIHTTTTDNNMFSSSNKRPQPSACSKNSQKTKCFGCKRVRTNMRIHVDEYTGCFVASFYCTQCTPNSTKTRLYHPALSAQRRTITPPIQYVNA